MKTPKFLKSAFVLLITSATTFGLQGSAQAAKGDCPSGYICLWSGSQYGGTMKKFASTGTYHSIGLSFVNSYYNNRTKRTWLHSASDGSGTYVCLSPGAQSGSVSGWQESAKAVYLATVTNC
jgi:hypothetical protein